MSGGFPPIPLGNCTLTRTLGVPGRIIISGISRNGLLNIEHTFAPLGNYGNYLTDKLFSVSSLIWVHNLKFERP